MIIEFYGIAGVGKSTLAAALLNKLQVSGVAAGAALAKASLYKALASRGAQDCILAAKVMSVIKGRTSPPSRGLFADLIKGRAARKQFPVWITDQGICQRVGTIHKRFQSGWEHDWLPLLRNHPAMPDAVIIVTAPAAVIRNRVKERDGQTIGCRFYKPAKERGRHMKSDLAEYFSEYTSEARVLTVENGRNASLHDQVERLARSLSDLSVFPCQKSLDSQLTEISRSLRS